MAGDLAVVRRIIVGALWLQAALEEAGGEGRRLSSHPNESIRQATFASSSAVARAKQRRGSLGIDAPVLAACCFSHPATPSRVQSAAGGSNSRSQQRGTVPTTISPRLGMILRSTVTIQAIHPALIHQPTCPPNKHRAR